MTKNHVIQTAKNLCEKFILKVETGRARSVETYNECKVLLAEIDLLPDEEED